MKKALVWILVLALLAVASVLGTIAYLTDEAKADNVMTVGNVKISLLEFERTDVETPNATNSAVVQEFSNKKKPLLPAVIESGFDYTASTAHSVDWNQPDKDGKVIKPNYSSNIWDPTKINNEVDKMVFVKNTGDYSAYVRIFFAFEAGNYVDFEDFQKKIHLNINETDWNFEWIPFVGKSADSNYFVASAIYPKELAPGAVTEIALSQIALDSSADNETVDAFGDGYSVKVCAQAIQSTGFGAPKQALLEGFGRGIPFDDIYIEGATMYNALRYLDGDLEGENITNKVTSITFGLNNAYPEIADNYQGTPINDEQDYYVNVHYVPEGENFKLYVLADGPIYTPVDSTKLFYDMPSMVTVDTTNLNTSRTTTMYCMFYSCDNLKNIDLSNWEVEKVINISAMFQECSSLEEISFGGWKTESLTNMSFLFYGCDSLKKANVYDLDTGKVTTMKQVFYGCGALESIEGLNKWETSKVTDMQQMFLCLESDPNMLKEIDISNFDSSSVTVTSYMFSGCSSLETVHFGENWDMAQVTSTNHMFDGCTSLQNINVVTKWKTDNLKEAKAMFRGCSLLTTDDLTTLGVSNWKTDNVTKMSSMFSGCSSLTTLDLSRWNTANVTHMEYVFNNCSSLTALDVSGWKTDNVKFMSSMFNGCVGLTALDLSSCNTKSIQKSENMFAGCSNLVTISVGNGWNVTKASSSADMFKDCTKLVGGNGTTLAKIKENEGKEVVDKTYARVDTAENPGYLTYKEYVPATPEA